MITIIDLLQVIGIRLGNYKIHLATGQREQPLDAYFAGRFKEWQEQQNSKNFQCDEILSLINMYDDIWLFVGVYKVLGVRKGEISPYLYNTELLPDQEDLIGKVIVQFRRDFRASYVWGYNFGNQLKVSEIKPQPITIEEFPGYNNVRVSFNKLKLIILHQESSWKSALSNVKGVYLIADKASGKLYVGSAKGETGIWQRWLEYANSGHGGNSELKDLLNQEGADYANNFQFALLEMTGFNTMDETIIARENYWKDNLLSRQFGYNSN